MSIRNRFNYSVLVIALVFAITSCADKGYIIKSGGYRSQRNTISEASSGSYKVGKPYEVFGIMYYPQEDYEYNEVGVSSWYGEDFHAKKTANGEKYDMNSLTAAHKTLPLPSIVRVTNLENGRSLILRVNDRGPFVNNRIIDVSKRAAKLLGFKQQGTTKVRVQILEEESKKLKERLTGISSINTNSFSTPKTASANSTSIIPAVVSKSNTSPLSASNGRFHLQIGSFAQKDNAINLKNSLSDIGDVSIIPVDISGTKYYRVRMVGFKTEREAQKAFEAVEKTGLYGARIIEE
jgi:rare lipoprotein A